MADNSKIEWTDASWNPVTGCTKVSPGCDHCYAETFAERWRGTPGHHFEQGFDVTLRPERLEQPLRWTRPRRIFVNSMSDLFHGAVPDLFIEQVFDVMEQAKQHTFQLLTKRHARMRSFVKAREARRQRYAAAFDDCPTEAMRNSPAADWARKRAITPPANIWLGVSVEDQKWADIRVPALLETPAAVHWLSCEPLLGPVDLVQAVNKLDWLSSASLNPGGIDWVVAGGESGPGARPMHPVWARQLRDQCAASDLPFFFKQWGVWSADADHVNATHLLQINGSLVDRKDATVDNPYGAGSGLAQDLVDRGHPGWVRVRRVSKNAAGRVLDGRTHDDFPTDALVSTTR